MHTKTLTLPLAFPFPYVLEPPAHHSMKNPLLRSTLHSPHTRPSTPPNTVIPKVSRIPIAHLSLCTSVLHRYPSPPLSSLGPFSLFSRSEVTTQRLRGGRESRKDRWEEGKGEPEDLLGKRHKKPSLGGSEMQYRSEKREFLQRREWKECTEEETK